MIYWGIILESFVSVNKRDPKILRIFRWSNLSRSTEGSIGNCPDLSRDLVELPRSIAGEIKPDANSIKLSRIAAILAITVIEVQKPTLYVSLISGLPKRDQGTFNDVFIHHKYTI